MKRKHILTILLLSITLVFAGILRLTGQNWDDFSYSHPDERFLTALLLPSVGGNNEFTNDDSNFPGQNILVRSGTSTIAEARDLINGYGMRVGSVLDSFSAEAAQWLSSANQIQEYANQPSALQALHSGQIDAVLLDAIATSSSAGLMVADDISSQELQSLRCKYLYPESNGIGGYFDARCSPLNPHQTGHGFYVYGTFPLFLAHFGGQIVRDAFDAGLPLFNWQGGHLVWRGFSLIFDLLTVLLIFALGTRLHNRWVGLIAAILYAAAPLAIQKAHFGTTNAIAAGMVTLALYFAVAVQQRGKLSSYLMFGVACGTAVASRMNLAPLAGLVVIAALVQSAPAFDRRLSSRERSSVLVYHFIGLILAGLATFLAFRIFNPYTFIGPGFFNFLPNDRWFDNLASGSRGVSGLQDFPPNWMWFARASYFYPLKDMFLWAMGPAMALLAWFGWCWSAFRVVGSRKGALANLLLVLWIGAYFVWMNQLWPMTMRYYLPLYSALSVLAGWSIYNLYLRARRAGIDLLVTRLLLLVLGMFFGAIGLYQVSTGVRDATAITSLVFAAVLLFTALAPFLRFRRAAILGIFAVGFTVVWGVMFGNVYRHQTTLVQSSRYLFERVPGNFAMRISGSDDSIPLVNLAFDNSGYSLPGHDEKLFRGVTNFREGQPASVGFTAPASGFIASIIAPHLLDPAGDPAPERLEFRVYGPDEDRAIAEATLVTNLPGDGHPLGESYEIFFDEPLLVEAGQSYRFEVAVASGSGEVLGSGSVVLTEGDWDNRVTGTQTCQMPSGVTLADRPASGLAGYHECHGTQAFYKLITSYDQIMSFPVDNQIKADSILNTLDIGDYLTIASNRFYDTETRNRMRWPLTTRYYQKLFAGKLGYELVAVFEETFEFGPWRVSDQHLPIYESPAWLNEIEADEAFHVYDHPTVFIFRKTADYSRAQVEAELSSVSIKQAHEITREGEQAQLLGLIYWSSYDADPVPTALTFPDADYETQTAGGTWSERFFSDSPANSNQVLGVVFWYLALMAIGIVAFPLVFSLFPNLADGGYGVSKLTGMLLLAWFAWAASTLKLPLWSQTGLVLLLALLVLFSLILGYRNRAELGAFLHQHWKRLAWMEVIALLAFLFMIGIRLTNPDLWHPYKGGEKPMDFAYLNGVLRSTTFPPLDPWFAGGFINYYYFGYVLVGVPALLLGIVPAFAYNLMIPTIFSLTGGGAFSAAFNIMSRWNKREPDCDKPAIVAEKQKGSPWTAGILALLICVVLGNLDTVRVLGKGVAELGGYRTPEGLEQFLAAEYLEENGIEPASDAIERLAEQAKQSNLLDNMRYETHNSLTLLGGIVRGTGRLLSGESLPLSHDRWYWGPSRVLAETPGVRGNAITEMPYFTFLYGDLHAHMINMPLILLTVVFVFNELVQTGRDQRKALERFLALALGGLAVGVMRATNTWDWPSMSLFVIAGLGYCWWVRWQRGFRGKIDLQFYGTLAGLLVIALAIFTGIQAQVPQGNGVSLLSLADAIGILRKTLFAALALLGLWIAARHLLVRASALDLLGSVGGFLLLNFGFALPYTTWYAANYNSVRLWQGGKTPLWAYFDIHGLFLFLVASLVLWETSNWLRTTPVAALRGRVTAIRWAGISFLAVVLLSIVLGLAHFQVALIVLPLLGWIAMLFFRAGQSRSMRYVLVLIGLALSMTLGVEIIVVGGDIGRQNTVFKFYIQAWILLSVAAGVGFSMLFSASEQWRRGLRLLWFTPCVLLFVIAGAFPIVATRARSLDRMVPDLPLTLNGMDYMKQALHYESSPEKNLYGTIDLSTDHKLIRWMQENVSGSPVIMEGRKYPSEYQWNGRFSITTGLPSVVGWSFHQRQQRTFDPLPRWVEQRDQNVRTFYDTDDIDIAVDMINHFDVKYIIRSGLEELHSTVEGLAKLERMVELGLLTIAYEIEGGSIYQVNEDALHNYLVERFK